jgi:FlaA1/EpsC-like NDP-sugar epimerase
MGASKRIMEDLVMAYNKYFKVTTARFANVAFSNGSLPDGWIHRLQKKQPLVAPSDVKRYFVSPEESGQICMLACILGKGGEVFFPKLGEDQMLTFSEICDGFVKANGFEKDPCASDKEAILKASQLDLTDSQLSTLNSQLPKYPTVYFKSDTTGEKAYEEFYVPGEKIDMERFKALGVVEQTSRHQMDEVNGFFDKLERIFAKDDFTKAQVVDAIKEFIPNFEHEEKGKNLDQKM